MISVSLAQGLRDAGLRWHPRSGDAFSLTSAELEGEVFTVSDMTIESHEFDTGTILGFNGTTEWALDSVAIEDALWLPREEQLRQLLGGTFRSLVAGSESGSTVTGSTATGFTVTVFLGGAERAFEASDAADAYGMALLALIAGEKLTG